MLATKLDCKDAVLSDEGLAVSPMDSPREAALDGAYGLSATTSECSSQPNSYNNRDDLPDGAPLPANERGGIGSWMPIVDEEDEQVRTLAADSSSLPDPAGSQAISNDTFHKAAYESQVRRWQEEETAYMKHEGWCEQRLVLLMQEAFRSSHNNLKRSRASGDITEEVYAARVSQLKLALVQIKKEYRRTLQRTRERNGDVPGIASRAVTCIASVYPWSTTGFVLGFEENRKFGELSGVAGSANRRGSQAAPPPVHAPASACMVPLAPCADSSSNNAAAECDEGASVCQPRRLATPRVALRPLPARRHLFQTGMAPDGSPLVSPARTTAGQSSGTFLTAPSPSEAARSSLSVVSPNALLAGVPTTVPSPSIAGPIRSDEHRFLEKRQIVVLGSAFVSRSLASSLFIASRRATVAAATTRVRLASTRTASSAAGAPQPPSAVRPSRAPRRLEAGSACVADAPAPAVPACTAPAPSPPAPIGLVPQASAAAQGQAASPKKPRAKKTAARFGGQPAPALPGATMIRPGRQRPMPAVASPPPCLPQVVPMCLPQVSAPRLAPYAPPSGVPFHPNPMPPAPVMVSPIPYGHAVAVAGDYTLVYPVQYPPSYPSHIRRDRLCVDPVRYPNSFATMPAVSPEEEKHVKELW